MTQTQFREYLATQKMLFQDPGIHTLDEINHALQEFAICERRLHVLYLKDLDGKGKPRSARRWEERAKLAAYSIGCRVLFNDDPRGPAITIHQPRGRTHTIDWVY